MPYSGATLITAFLLIIAHLNQVAANEGPSSKEVEVEILEYEIKTLVKGTEQKTWTGEFFYAFRGIPYVKPPIGDLRFKDPQPLERLPDFIDARYDGHDCPSIYAVNASEDCLNLNIYTKSPSYTASLPVLFFIHPGGLYLDSGLSSFIGPSYLLNKPLVLVTFNYRLGTLGFLHLNTSSVPGNAGFKDQVMALRWVYRNIHHFGGNANDITIMGYSAGSLSVQMHLVSPMSQGLYHKAIMMSGALPAQTRRPPSANMDLIRRQLKALNCSSGSDVDEAAILACLRQFSGTEIAATLRQLFAFGLDNAIYLWLPLIEQKHFEQERFLSVEPYAAFEAGDFAKVPILVGFTDGEFCTSAANIVKNSTLESEFYAEFDNVAPYVFIYEQPPDMQQQEAQASRVLREHYLNDSSAGNTNVERLCDFFSDALIRYGSQRFAELAAKYVKVYTYKFDYKGRYSYFNYDMAKHKARAEHMDDLMYLFESRLHRFAPSEPDAPVVELYTNFIYDFMKNGELKSDKAVHFPHAYALINTEVSYKQGTFFNNDTYALWKRLFA